jgi:UDP-N-acetylmuramyl pentapeptide phosphotransferase/UDP-N-acetylglucosamine-1-phosphate transferase
MANQEISWPSWGDFVVETAPSLPVGWFRFTTVKGHPDGPHSSSLRVEGLAGSKVIVRFWIISIILSPLP